MNPSDNPKMVICLGRQLASGGSEIARYLAQELGFGFFDKELIYAAAARSGYSTDLFEEKDEEKSDLHSFFSHLIPFVGSADYYGNHVDEDFLFRILSDTIHQIATEENCVIVGRCAEYILRDYPGMTSIFISADTDERIRRLCQSKEIQPASARKLLTTNDKRRAAFHDFYSSCQWGHASTYHLCINQSVLGMEATKSFVLDFVRRRYHLS